jgi:hypothetical protein
MNSTMGKFDITVIIFVCCTLFCLETSWELPVSIIHELEHPVSIIYELSWYYSRLHLIANRLIAKFVLLPKKLKH